MVDPVNCKFRPGGTFGVLLLMPVFYEEIDDAVNCKLRPRLGANEYSIIISFFSPHIIADISHDDVAHDWLQNDRMI